jgi:hypothetical protein
MVKQRYQKISKHLKYLFLFCIGIALGLGMLLWHPFSGSYYSSLAITYDKNGYPLLTIHLQDQDYVFAVDIGSRFPLSLTEKMLDGIIDKQLQDTITVHNINGQKREASSYLIPEIKIGDLTLKNVIAHESQGKEHGILGKFLGGDFNLLLDFPHSRIIACDTFAKLQAKKLVEKNWVRIPFEIQRGGVVFHIDTDFGTRRLAVNTISTFNHLQSSFIPSGKPCASSPLVLEGQRFGNVTFESIDLPDVLREIDGFIGMDFLKEHAIYLDYTHKIAYIKPPARYLERIPITFASRGSPTVDVSIEGNIYPLELDIGSPFPFSLRQEILQNIHKTSYGNAEWSDFRGNKYESRAYTIPEIKIGNLLFANVIAKQNREDFHVNTTADTLPSQPIGAIGLPILKKYNLFLDFSHSIIYASYDHLLLQRAGLLSQNLLTIPFVLHPDGILLSVETDEGTCRLILDTGCTHTAIRAPHQNSITQFRLMGHDFGARSIFPIDLNSHFDYDGYLGMDFLSEYSLFIDYSNGLIFLDLQKDR